ncbi:MAG: hypothetical protein DRM99_05380, partial [Thermoplasmata archaeon]
MMKDDSKINKEKVDRITTDIEDISSVYLKSNHPVFIVNRKGIITDVNDVFCKKIGVNSEEIIGKNIEDVDFLTEGGRKNARIRYISRLLGKETPVYSLDVVTSKGDVVTLDIDAKPIVKQGRVTGEVGVITKMKKVKGKKEVIKESEKTRVKRERREKEDDVDLSAVFEKIKERDEEIKRIKSELDKKHLDVESHKEDLY